MTAKIPIVARLEPAQVEALDAIGERQDRSRSWLVRKAVEEFIERNAEPREEASDIERH